MLQKYLALLKADWGIMFEYRAAIAIWMLNGLAPLIPLAVWLSIVRDGQAELGYDAGAFISYYLAAVVLRQATAVWVSWELDRMIRYGELSPWLLRPINVIHHEITANLAEKALRIPLILLVIVPAALLLPGVQYDFSPLRLASALLALAGAWAINFFSYYVIGLLAFWITQVTAITQVWYSVRMLLAGVIAPIDLLPGAIARISPYLPFRYMLSFPIEIVTGRVAGGQILFGLLVMGLWVLCFWGLVAITWRRGLRRYGAVGA